MIPLCMPMINIIVVFFVEPMMRLVGANGLWEKSRRWVYPLFDGKPNISNKTWEITI